MTPEKALSAESKAEPWHTQTAEEILVRLASSAEGLSSQEAAQRLASSGPNELREGDPISPLHLFLGQFKSLIIWILIAAGVISGVLGEVLDCFAILAIVVLNAAIGFYQEFKAEKSIAALKKLTLNLSRAGFPSTCQFTHVCCHLTVYDLGKKPLIHEE